jgi:hypothetical protein
MRLRQVALIASSATLLATTVLENHGADAATQRHSTNVSVVSSLDVEVALGVQGDEKLEHGVYIFHLKCSGSCELSRITLNQCVSAKNAEPSFAPRVDYWSSSRWIKAQQIGNDRVELTIFQAYDHGLPAKMTWIFNSSGTPFTTLRELRTSSFIDYREFPNKVVPVDFVPVSNDRLKLMDCPVRLRGLNP